MTPSIAPAQSSHQVVSPTQGVPARDGDPSPFEAYLGTLRKSLTLSAFTLAPPAPSVPVQPAPEGHEPSAPADSRAKQDPAAQDPTPRKAEVAESSHPKAEAAPDEPPKRKDSAEPSDPARAQPQTDPLCTPVPHAEPQRTDDTSPRLSSAQTTGPEQHTAPVSPPPLLSVATPVRSEPAQATIPRPEPTVGPRQPTETARPTASAATKPSEAHPEPPASKQPGEPFQLPPPATDAPGDHVGESAEPKGDRTIPVSTAQKAPAAAKAEAPILSITAEPHAQAPSGPVPQQTAPPIALSDAGNHGQPPEPGQTTPPAEHRIQAPHAQAAPKPQPPEDQPAPPPAEVRATDKPAPPAPQPHADPTPQANAGRSTSQPNQSSAPAPNSQPSGAQAADAAAQATPQAPARAPAAPLGADRTAARPIGAVAGSSAPISSKEALGKLSGQAPVLRQAVEQQSVVLQTARGLAAALKNGDGTVTLSLQPPRLGQLKVHLTLADGLIRARMEPSTQAARQLLIDSEHSLRAALEARGLSVERIEVDAVKPPPHASDAAPGPEPHTAADHGPDPDTPSGDNAGPGYQGEHAGSGAEAHAGSAERTEAPVGEPGIAAVTYALDGGGTYRLRLDALA